MTTLLFLQLVLPLVLLAWALIWPARDALGRGGQLAVLGAVIANLFVSGVWLFPPWWTAWIWTAGLVIVLIAVVRRRPERTFPTRFSGYIRALALAGAAAYAGLESWLGFQGRHPPEAPMVDLQFPLASGTYLVVNGGTNLRINSHVATLNPAFRGHRNFLGQSHAVDIMKLNAWGGTSDGILPRDPREWEIYGDLVLAPCSGRVKLSRDGVPDTPVPIPDRETMTGNFVLLACESNVEVLLAHLAPGSLKVSQGQPVDAGQPLGLVGNTGNTDAPHLHIHAQRPAQSASPFAGQPLAATFDGRYLVRGDHVVSSAKRLSESRELTRGMSWQPSGASGSRVGSGPLITGELHSSFQGDD